MEQTLSALEAIRSDTMIAVSNGVVQQVVVHIARHWIDATASGTTYSEHHGDGIGFGNSAETSVSEHVDADLRLHKDLLTVSAFELRAGQLAGLAGTVSLIRVG